MRLVDDDEIPAQRSRLSRASSTTRNPGDRGDDLVPLLPGVLAVVGAQHVAADDLELLAELVLQLALPLEGQVGRRDDERRA